MFFHPGAELVEVSDVIRDAFKAHRFFGPIGVLDVKANFLIIAKAFPGSWPGPMAGRALSTNFYPVLNRSLQFMNNAPLDS